MKVLFVTIKGLSLQGDYLELTILNGLKKILGDNVVDFPRKDVMYDSLKINKENLHGNGFTLLRNYFNDNIDRDIFNQEFDAIIYGDGHMYGEEVFINKIDNLCKTKNIWVIDGHDLYGNARIKKNYLGKDVIGNQYKNSFKRELVFEEEGVYPTGFGIPEECIMPINFDKKNKLFQSTYPKYSFFENPNDLGTKNHHIFNNENEYYKDLSESWFGLCSIRGGWDSLRLYEIIAAGSVLLYRDFHNKPINCSPQNLPAITYSTKDELYEIMTDLVKDDVPTEAYKFILEAQRNWLENNGTTSARAKKILNTIFPESLF